MEILSTAVLQYKLDDYVEIDNQISKIIDEACLNKANNDFFLITKNLVNIDIKSAFQIAYNWKEITKNFLFTSIKGLGFLADNISEQADPNLQLLAVLQTGFSVISDDIGNTHPHFKEHAPFGIKGIHYKWWEDTILKKLNPLINENLGFLTPSTISLVNEMKKLSNNYLGIAVQLRIVEAIALDICISFLAIFSQVKINNEHVFKTPHDLAWITSHIQAETVHHAQVCNSMSGMARIATTDAEKKELITLTRNYAFTWADALSNFKVLLG